MKTAWVHKGSHWAEDCQRTALRAYEQTSTLDAGCMQMVYQEALLTTWATSISRIQSP